MRPSLIGTPSSLTGCSTPGWASATTISRAATSSDVERLVELEHRLEAAVVLGGEHSPLLAGSRGEDL